MVMGKTTVNALGFVASAVILGGVIFGAAVPIISQKNANELSIEQAKIVGEGFTGTLSELQGGASEQAIAATELKALFEGLVPEAINIESASRAIAASLPEGVRLESFNFSSTKPVEALTAPAMTIGGYVPPAEFTVEEAAAPDAGVPIDPDAPPIDPLAPLASGATPTGTGATLTGLNRIPFTITVTANSYGELSDYLNQLSQQPRLMSVVSIDSSRTESVSATIYAYAYAGR